MTVQAFKQPAPPPRRKHSPAAVPFPDLRPAPGTVTALAETFKALGDPTRLLIVATLAREERCVCDLATLVGVSESAVSHSLRTLRQLRLVRYRKAGKIAYYTLDDAHVARLVAEGIRHVEEGA